MRIIIDAMGGDYAPQVPVEAAVKAVCELDVDIALVGKEAMLRKELSKYTYSEEKITVVNADEVITNNEKPAIAVRRKKNASITVAAVMLKNNEGDALISMGSTGAVLSAGALIVGRIRGILRPALGTLLPTATGPKMLIDSGANTNCKGENLVQFAVMGDIYMRKVMGIENPRIGLISNGEEEGKGNKLAKEAYELLKKENINFIGNIEGRDIMEGKADVMTTEGFVGNIVLKTVEGMGSMLSSRLKILFKKNPITLLGALFVKGGLKELKKSMDYREYGGAPLLGLKKLIVKAHGSSDTLAAFNAIKQAKGFVENKVTEDIENYIKNMEERTYDIC